MKMDRIERMVRGWFVGGFEPTAHHTMEFEVGYRVHPAGSKELHYHTRVKEINLMITGRMTLQGREIVPGDIFVIEPWEITKAEFLEDSGIVCVKVPSGNDKVNLQEV
jgi:hypothetical protein